MVVGLSVDLLWRFVIAGVLCRENHELRCAVSFFLLTQCCITWLKHPEVL